MRRTLNTLVGLAFLLSSIAQAQVTQAWRNTYPLNTPNLDQYRNALDVDASGNAYIQRANRNLGTMQDEMTLAKFDFYGRMLWSNNALIGQSGSTDGGFLSGVHVSPVISGQQYVYACMEPNYVFQNTRYRSFWMMKYSTSGQPLWPQPFTFKVPNMNTILRGFYADPNGNVFLALGVGAASDMNDSYPLSTCTLTMLEVDASGNQTNQQENTLIGPSNWSWRTFQPCWIHDVFEQEAIFDPSRHRWIVAGSDNLDLNQVSARWGIYNPDNGSEDYSETEEGTPNFGTSPWFDINRLPGGYIAVADNEMTPVQGSGGWAVPILKHRLKLINPQGSVVWRYPAVANDKADGAVFEIKAFSGTSQIYVAGDTPIGESYTTIPRFMERFDWQGNLIYRNNSRPVETLLMEPAGFFSVCWREPVEYDPSSGAWSHGNSEEIVEHFDGTAFDFGKNYTDTGNLSGNAATITGAAVTRDSAYVLSYWVDGVNWPYPGYVSLDRFVLGLALQSVHSPSSSSGNATVPVTIALNKPAGSYGYPVGLFSNNSALLMPNGSRAQNFRVPAGQSSLTVNLTAGSVSANTTVTLLATQNGVKRVVATTITP